MNGRFKSLHTILSILTVIVLLVLLVYTVNLSNDLAAERSRQAVEATTRNRDLLRRLEGIVRDVQSNQAEQRDAFRRLARRNEQLHGNDPDEAPDFDSMLAPGDASPVEKPSGVEPERGQGPQDSPNSGEQDDGRDDAPKDEKRRDRPPRERPSPSPSPTPPNDEVCVPLTNVCIDPALLEIRP